jgi:hypothetical protein
MCRRLPDLMVWSASAPSWDTARSLGARFPQPRSARWWPAGAHPDTERAKGTSTRAWRRRPRVEARASTEVPSPHVPGRWPPGPTDWTFVVQPSRDGIRTLSSLGRFGSCAQPSSHGGWSASSDGEVLEAPSRAGNRRRRRPTRADGGHGAAGARDLLNEGFRRREDPLSQHAT